MAEAQVLAVLVVHASGSWLDETLEALGGIEYPGLEFCVATVGEVRTPVADRLGPDRVREVVEVEAGSGFGRAAIEAVNAAVRPDDTHLLFLHDDVTLEPETLSRLVARIETGTDVAAAGTKIFERDEPGVLQEVGGSIDRFAVRRTGLERGEVDHGQHDENEDVLFCSAACLLVRRDAYEEVGGLDPDAWPLYEDVDLGWRLRAAGHRVVVVPDARVRHAAGLSRGMRRGAGQGFGALGVRTATERGRLRFMLKNYAPLSLLAVLPQYLVVVLAELVSGLVRREFWRLRILLSAWVQVGAELPSVLDLRRRAAPRRVDDQELLAMGARRALVERRYERVATIGRVMDSARRVEQRLMAVVRDPVAWVGLLATVVLLVVLRGVLFGGVFTLGELRPLPRLTDAVGAYLARPGPEGLTPYLPDSPGILALGALRSVLLGSSALAEKVALLGPLAIAGFGALRLGRVLGLGDRGRRWLALVAVVNPVTLVLAQEGFVGALLGWAASMWTAAALLAPVGEEDDLRQRYRRRARWALGWGATAALHPPALVWLLALGTAIAVARRGDGAGPRRRSLIVLGATGAFVLCLPWSAEWVTARTPLVGHLGGFLRTASDGIEAASLGGGWAFIAWTAVALVAVLVVGATRTTAVLTMLLSLAWLAGVTGAIPVPTALAAAGWCALVLLAFVARRVSEELRLYELGWRHAVVIGIVVTGTLSWVGGAVASIAEGTDAQHVPVVPATASDGPGGRVLWLMPAGGGVLGWATDGFRAELRSFPISAGPEQDLVAEALEAARAGRTHRLGAVLALADVSHVVALSGEAEDGLGAQADVVLQERQTDAAIYRNEAWRGTALGLATTPLDVLSPRGLADLVRTQTAIEAGSTDGSLALTLPEDPPEVVYLAVGAHGGWRIGDAATHPAAAGVWADASDLGSSVRVDAAGDWRRWFFWIQGALVVALVGVWLAATYLAAPGTSGPGGVPPEDVRLLAPAMPRAAALVPLIVLGAAAWLAWPGPGVRAASGPFLSSAWYCPPAGEGFDAQSVQIANPHEGDAEYLVRPALTSDAVDSGPLEGLGRETVEVDPAVGAVVESYGRRAVVSTTITRTESGSDSTLCASEPLQTSYFAEGGRGATNAQPRLFERYVLYNPFPDLARASVRFFTTEREEQERGLPGAVSPPALQDIRVPPGESVLVDPEGQFFFPIELSTEIEIWQGRAVVARRLYTSEEASFSLGTGLTTSGVVPRAATSNGDTEIQLLNPTDLGVQVTVEGAGEEGSIGPLSFEVPAQRRLSFDLDDPAPDFGGLVARVRAERPVAIETLFVPDDRGLISLLPLLEPHRRWAVPAAEGRWLVVANPSTRALRLEITPLGSGGERRVETVPASRLLSLRLDDEPAFGLLVEADGPVTTMVVGSGGDIAGVPLG